MVHAAAVLCALLLGATPPAPQASGEVTLRVEEYRSLVDAAADAKARRQLREGDALVTEARFTLDLEGETGRFAESFNLRSDASGWASVPVVHGTLDAATVAPSEGAFYFANKDGVTSVFLPGAGSWKGEIGQTLRAAVEADGRRSFRFKAPFFPVQRGRVSVAETDLEVTTGGAAIIARSEDKGRTTLDLALRPGADVVVALRERNLEEKRRQGPLRTEAVVYSRSEVVAGDLVTEARVRVEATSGKIAGVEFALPAGAKFLFLRGSGLIADEPQGGHVSAKRALAAPEPLEARLRFTSPLGDENAVSLPLATLVGEGTVETYVELRAPDGVLIESGDPGSFEVVDAAQLPAEFQAEAREAEEILHRVPGATPLRAPTYRLHRVASAAVLAAQVRALRVSSLVSRTNLVLTRLDYDVVASAKSFLTLELPEATELWGAQAEGRPLVAAAPEAGSVALPLRSGRGRIAHVSLYLLSEISFPDSSGRLALALPAADVPIARIDWAVTLPSDVTWKLVPGDYSEGRSTAEGGAAGPTVEAVERSELGDRAREALAGRRETEGREPLVARLPASPVAVQVHSALPAARPQPLRLEVERVREHGAWR